MSETTPEGKVILKTKNEFMALWNRRFSEIVELKAIGEGILKDMKGKTTGPPGELKEELNNRIWEVM